MATTLKKLKRQWKKFDTLAGKHEGKTFQYCDLRDEVDDKGQDGHARKYDKLSQRHLKMAERFEKKAERIEDKIEKLKKKLKRG